MRQETAGEASVRNVWYLRRFWMVYVDNTNDACEANIMNIAKVV